MFRNFKTIRVFIWVYLIPLLMVVAYTIINHQMHGFTEKAAHTMMYPFYNDHTAYAAMMAMFLPLVIAFIFDKKNTKAVRVISFFITVMLLTTLVLSYTRAAWVSLAAALVVYLIFYFKIRFSVVFACMATALILFLTYQKDILLRIEENKQQSATDFNKHIQSISNISTDASNLERLNRWHSAIRMFKLKPFFGWGPGTYQFNYAPFQQAKEKTIISTNMGDRGNAHSEYISPLTESGVLGLITFAMVLIAVIYRAIMIYSKSRDKEIRMLTLGVFLGLITYMVHGALNNFLDTDKAAVPFWGFVAILVAIDIYHFKKEGNTESEGA
jgi:O-antigen ligase